MRFGLTGIPLGQMGVFLDASPHQVVTTLARAADDLGFEFVAAQDHTLAPRGWAADGGGVTWFEPFVVLSWAAAVTTRVRLLTDVIVLPYRPPFSVAKIGASLDALSGGRLILGVAAGYLEQEFEILKAPFAERGAVTDESIEVIKAAWQNEWLSFNGEHFGADDVAVSPLPEQKPRPPIWVGGNSMRALRRAVEHADGWTPFRVSPDVVRAALARAHDLGLGDRPFDVCVPLRGGVYAADGSLDFDSIRRQADEYTAAGVTVFKIGFKGPSLSAYTDAMATFAAKLLGT